MKRTSTIIAFLIAGLGLTGCQKDETVAGYGAADKLWVLESINDQSFTARATLTFPEPGKIEGQAPCNRFFASQTAPYPWFRTGPVGTTKMACPELDAERLFLSTLEDMTLVEVLGDTLILSNDAGYDMLFKAAP